MAPLPPLDAILPDHATLAAAFAVVLRATLQASLVVLVILTARLLLGRRLTPRARYALWGLLALLRDQGKVILIVTHHLHLAARRSDRVWVLSDGQLAADAPPEEAMRPDRLESVFHVPFQRHINEQGSVFLSYG